VLWVFNEDTRSVLLQLREESGPNLDWPTTASSPKHSGQGVQRESDQHHATAWLTTATWSQIKPAQLWEFSPKGNLKF
jgi:hypothetical protein